MKIFHDMQIEEIHIFNLSAIKRKGKTNGKTENNGKLGYLTDTIINTFIAKQ